MVAVMTAGYSIVWWLLYWVPNGALVLPARLLLSVAYVYEAFFIGTAYSGLLWCGLAGAVAHVACGFAGDALGSVWISYGQERQQSENIFLQPKHAKKQKDAKKAREKPDKYLYRLARASEPARDGDCRPHRDGFTIGQQLLMEGSGCRMNRSLNASYRGNPDVDGEGYLLHVWTAAQLREAAARHFAGVDDLILLKFSRAWLLESDVEICYEEADAAAVHAREDESEPRPGAYPHIYAGKCSHPHLSYMCLVGHYRLPLAPNGEHIFPRDAFADDREQDWDDDPGMFEL